MGFALSYKCCEKKIIIYAVHIENLVENGFPIPKLQTVFSY